MKTNERRRTEIEFTRGNSSSPLPGIRSADLQANKEDEKKDTRKDVSEHERKRIAAENDAKIHRTREKQEVIKESLPK